MRNQSLWLADHRNLRPDNDDGVVVVVVVGVVESIGTADTI